MFWMRGLSGAVFGLSGIAAGVAHAQQTVWTTPEYELGWQLTAVQAARAYELGLTGAGVTIGVVDSGVDTRHPEFEGRILDGYDFVNDVAISGSGNFDHNDHGSHVIGIIAANRDGKGMHGVAFDAQVIPVVFDYQATDRDEVFPQAWNLLSDSGVSIISNSIGANDCSEEIVRPCNVTDYEAGFLEENFPDTIAALRRTAEQDILMVFATGNEAQPAPDVLAGMPFWIPELRDNWLAVAAIDADLDYPRFNNRCGVAAEWCLVAPGVDVYSTAPLGSTDNFDPDYQLMDGTSMATPVVTGVAALVKQAFPFFTAKDLQQTLLTTALDMGDPDRFGWGLLNANGAVRGYGAFQSAVFLDTAGHDATFGNDIGGGGSLVKTGAGTLTMTGTNTYAGGTTVAGGGLTVDGTLSSRVDVGLNGVLRGTGAINAPLAVAGRLAPGNSPGTLTVTGPVVLRSSATTQFDIDGTGIGNGRGNYSRLLVTGPSGVIGVDGTLAPTMRGITGDATNTYVAALGARFDVIQADEGVSGSFDTLAQPGTGGLARATRFDTIYGTRRVDLVVTPQSYGDLAANGLSTTANENAVGAALDAARPEAGPRAGRLFNGLYSVAATDLPAALGGLSGEVQASARAMHVDRAGMMRDSIADRINGGFAASDAPAAQGASVWSSAYGGGGTASGGGVSTFDWGTANLVIGADAALGDTTRLGIAGGMGRSSGSIDAYGSSATARHYDLVVYGSTVLGAFDASYGASQTWSSVSADRLPGFGTFAESLSSRYDAGLQQVFGSLGYKTSAAGFDLNPFVSGAYMHARGFDFAETGGVAALSGTVEGAGLGVTVAGLRVGRDFETGGGRLTTSAMVGWQHLMGSNAATAVVRFAGGSAFEAQGVALDRNALRLDLDVGYEIGNGFSAGLGYRGTFGATSLSSSVRGDVKLSF